jgi:hypothetical protein
VGQWAAQANRPAGSVQGSMAGKAALTGPTWEKTKKKGWTPHLGPWNYFFHARHLQDPDVKLTISGGRGDSRQVMPWHQSLFLHPSAQIDEGVVKEVVLL